MQEQKNGVVTAATASIATRSSLQSEVDERARCLYHLNKIRRFPLNDDQLQDWSKTIMRLRPEVSAERLQVVIDAILMGEYLWDPELGIQNIFKALNAPVGYTPQPEQ